MESPLGMAEAIHTMLLDSHGGLIRVFPAVPPEWKEAFFYSLRAEGAFRITARREGGQTAYVHVVSEAGAPLAVSPGWTGAIHVRYCDGKEAQAIPNEKGYYAIPLQKGQSALLTQRPGSPLAQADVAPIACLEGKQAQYHLWGSYKPWRLFGIPACPAGK
ncbi:MAG TPA: hypothetical protein PKE04_02455 [Clostridia bacterium]|nr:hypothetical protein [Clostridia bacterium]